MDEAKAIVNAADKTLSLSDKILGPWLTRRQSHADAEAIVHEALAQRVADLIDEFPGHPEVIDLLTTCGGRVGVSNLLHILQSAQLQLTDDARPELIGDDWFANFREKAKTCSDEEFTKLWASLLAGEVNRPRSYSRRTVNILGDMDTWSAKVFADLCRYVLTTEFGPRLIVPKDSIGPKVSNHVLDMLKGLGLIDFVVGHDLHTSIGTNIFGYDGGLLEVKDSDKSRRGIDIGSVHFTPYGQELARLCFPVGNQDGQIAEIIECWQSESNRLEVVKHAPIARASGRYLYSDASTGCINSYSEEQLFEEAEKDPAVRRAIDDLLLPTGTNKGVGGE